MPSTSNTLPTAPPTRATGGLDPANDVETLARRALGIAMNALYNGGHVTTLGAHDADVVDRARALLRLRVPDGPELALAVDLLDGAAMVRTSTGGTTGSADATTLSVIVPAPIVPAPITSAPTVS